MSGATVAGVDRRFLKPGWLVGHLLVLVAVLVCLRLGWWQWDRSQDMDGDAQNLGYAALWPVFGAGFIYMWIRFLNLELQRDEADDRELDDGLQELLADNDPAAPPGGSTTDDADPHATVSDSEVVAAEPVAPDSGDPTGPDEQTFVGTVEVSDDEDPELAAYNRALAAIAEEDRKRAR